MLNEMNTNTAITITGSGKIAAVIEGKAYSVDPTHPNYYKIIESIKAQDWDAFVKLTDIASSINAYVSEDVQVKDGVVYYKDIPIHNTLTERIIKFMREGLPWMPLCKFLENLMKNPSKRAVDELYTFLDEGELPITTDGCFLAYKNVRSDYKDIHSGTFDNSVGAICEMPRNQVCDDKDKTCSSGLHFCSIKYLPNFSDSDGGKTMRLKINPADVVSIPSDYNNTKGRCCRYEVVGEYTDDWRSKLDRGENGFDSPLYDEDGNEYDEDEQDCQNCGTTLDNYDEHETLCNSCAKDDEGLGNCCSCKIKLTNDNFNGNDDNICDNCYDDHYSGCYGGGCAGKTTLTDEDYVGNDGNDGCCGGSCPCDEKKPTPTPYHNIRDEKGRFIRKEEIEDSIIQKFVNKLKEIAKDL
jgi:hypothetical protein